MGQEAALRAPQFLPVSVRAMLEHDYGESVEATEKEE